tara:strand:+ start:13 stop:330 length:318 start_codon:yes stop_codon:yes gene_type:complete
MFAVIKTGGKQYQVSKGNKIQIEKLPKVKKGDKVIFDKVLLLVDDKDNIKLGTPYLDKIKVEGTLLNNIKSKKIDVMKYKNKIRYKRVYGHRQNIAEVTIDKIIS